MKKIILGLTLAVGVVSAGWLPSVFKTQKENQEKMLQSTSFEKIQNKIGKEPLMLEFGSVNCHSCQEMGRILYKIKQKFPNSNIYFIDIYEDMEAAKKFGIKIIPTQKYFDKSAKVIDTHMGVIEQDALEDKLKGMGIVKQDKK